MRILAVVGAVLLLLQMDWPVARAQSYSCTGPDCQAMRARQKALTSLQSVCETGPMLINFEDGAQAMVACTSQQAEVERPQPYSLPTGIDIVQVLWGPDGTFYLSCTNGRILWAQREGPLGWTSNWHTTHRPDVAEGGNWTLFRAGDEVWAHDARKMIRVWP